MKRYIKSNEIAISGDELAQQIANMLDKEGLPYEDCYCSDEDDNEIFVCIYTPINYNADKYLQQIVIDNFHPDEEEMYGMDNGEFACHSFVFKK